MLADISTFMEISKVIADDLWPLILSYDPNGPLKYASKKLFTLNIRFFRHGHWANDIETNIELLKLRPIVDVNKVIMETQNRSLAYAIIKLCDLAHLSGIITVICHMTKNEMFTDHFIHYAIKIVKDRYRSRGIVSMDKDRMFIVDMNDTEQIVQRPAINLIDEVIIIIGTFCILYCIEHLPDRDEALPEFVQNIGRICKSYYDDDCLGEFCKKMVISDISGYMGRITSANPGVIVVTWFRRYNFALPNYMEYIIARERPMIGHDDHYRRLWKTLQKSHKKDTENKKIIKQQKTRR